MEKKKLKYRLYIFVIITAFMVFATAGLGIESPLGPPLGSPIGNPTVPQTSLSRAGSKLMPTDQYSYGANGNLIVTGNVPSGRYFKHPDGIVLYRSGAEFYPSDFELATGFELGSLNSFIRRSAGLGYPDSGLSLNRPFYLPSQTVTPLRRWYESGLVPPKETFPGGTGEFAPAPAPISDSQYPFVQQRHVSVSRKDLAEVLAGAT